MILKKLGEEYKLYSHDSCIATTQESPHKRLSKQNCDEIFGVVDIEMLAVLTTKEETTFVGNEKMAKGFIKGFNKAMELNKDKLFTVEDVRKAMSIGLSIGYGRQFEIENKSVEIDSYIKSLQPTEIEVEIEMICPHPSDTYKCGLEFGCDEDGCSNPNRIPYLDKNSCLILKKK